MYITIKFFKSSETQGNTDNCRIILIVFKKNQFKNQKKTEFDI